MLILRKAANRLEHVKTEVWEGDTAAYRCVGTFVPVVPGGEVPSTVEIKSVEANHPTPEAAEADMKRAAYVWLDGVGQ